MKTITSTRTTASRKGKKLSAVFDRLSKDFGPSADHESKRVVGAVSLLVQLRRGEA